MAPGCEPILSRPIILALAWTVPGRSASTKGRLKVGRTMRVVALCPLSFRKTVQRTLTTDSSRGEE
jgi:hypothetical protein